MSGTPTEMTELLFQVLPEPVRRRARIVHEVIDPDRGPIDQPHGQISGLGTLFGDSASDEGAVAVATPRRLGIPAQYIPFDPSSVRSTSLAPQAAVQYLTIAKRAGPGHGDASWPIPIAICSPTRPARWRAQGRRRLRTRVDQREASQRPEQSDRERHRVAEVDDRSGFREAVSAEPPVQRRPRSRSTHPSYSPGRRSPPNPARRLLANQTSLRETSPDPRASHDPLMPGGEERGTDSSLESSLPQRSPES